MKRMPKAFWICSGVLVVSLFALYAFSHNWHTEALSAVTPKSLGLFKTIEEYDKELVELNTQKKYKESVELSDTLIKKYPEDYMLWLTRGIALYGAGKCPQAALALRHIWELNQHDEYLSNLLATIERSPQCTGITATSSPQ